MMLTPRTYQNIVFIRWPPRWVTALQVVRTSGAIHSTKIQTGPTAKRGPPQKTSFFETFPVGPNRSIEFRTEISGILVEWIAPIISRSQTSSLVSPPKFKTRKGILCVHAPYTTSPFEISWRSRTIGAVTLAILPIGKWLLSTGNNVLCVTQKNVKKTKYLGSFQGKFYGLIRTQCR